MKYKPRPRIEDQFKNNCSKIGGETRESGSTIRCRLGKDEELGYPKRTLVMDKAQNKAHLIQGGSSAELDTPKSVRVEEPTDNEREGYRSAVNGKAPSELVVEGLRGSELTVIGEVERR